MGRGPDPQWETGGNAAGTGPRDGRTVVQVYVSRSDSALERPVRWLGGHALVTAEAGCTTRVAIDLPVRAFQHWDTTARAWTLEPGSFTLAAGPSAGRMHLEASVELGRS